MSTYEYETGELGETGELEFGELELGETGELELGELGETGEQEQFLGGGGGGVRSPLSEAQELELASELLGVGSDQELEQFLGNIFRGVANAVGGAIKSPIGQALGGVLKNVAKAALPAVGGAIGTAIAPGFGTTIGSQLGSMAGNLFELEGEAASPEQAEFEAARQVVRLSAAAAQKAATAPPNLPPRQVASAAVAQAARQILPGALAPRPGAVRIGATPSADFAGGPGTTQPVDGRRLATLAPSARLAAGYAQGRPRLAGPAVGPGAPPHHGAPHRRRARYGGSGYRPDEWNGGVEEPLGIDAGYYGERAPYGLAGGAPYGAGGGRRSGRWVRRGRKIILLGA